MSKLGTKNVTTGEGSVQKTLEPGNTIAKINGIYLEEAKFKEGAYNVILSLEGEDLGTAFEGFYINKDQPELGRFKGRVANIKATLWPFADGITKSGVEISRDMEILKVIKQICVGTETTEWFNAQDEKHDTIEQLVEAFNKEKPFANLFYNFCIAGKEYKNKGGYTAYDLFLPKFTKDASPIEVLAPASSKLLKFNSEEHIVKKKVEAVTSFAPAAGDAFATTQSDFITESSADFDL